MDKEKEIEEMKRLVHKGFQIADMKNPHTGQPYPYFETQIRTITKSLLDAGYGNVKQAVKEFAEKVKAELEKYRLEHEYFIENEPNNNLWQMNSSIFYIEILDKGGLIDTLAKDFTVGGQKND